MNMKSFLMEEIGLISLSCDEVLGLEKLAKGFIASLRKVGVKAYVGGSLAKGTMVRREKQDVDVFVVFDYGEDVVKLEGVLKKVKLPGRLKRVHGSRDYFQIDCGDVLLEVIPVVKNRDPELAENVTDVSLRHVKYVVGEINKKSGLADEIKLAKVFCRANRVYGAESYVKGFSGYALEVLVIYYGSFLRFLKGVRKTKSFVATGDRRQATGRIVVDPLRYFKSDREVLNEINAAKLNGPVVLVDPTYKFRNVCAGLGAETFVKFNEVAKEFLKSPSLDFFRLKEIDVSGMKKMARNSVPSKLGTKVPSSSGNGRFVEVDLLTDRQEGDIAGTKMKKLFDFFVRELGRNGQRVLRKEFDYSGSGQKAVGYIVVKEVKEIEVRGPSVGLEDASEAFRKVNGDVFKRKGFWWVRREMSVEKVFELVKNVMGEMGATLAIRG